MREPSPSSRDVVLVLADHYAVLHWLTERLWTASTPRHRHYLFDEFAKALGGHLRGVDEAILPVLRRCGCTEVLAALQAGQREVQARLAELFAARHRDGDFDEQLSAFFPALRYQTELEVQRVLPALRKSLDASGRAALGAQLAHHFGLMFEQSEWRSAQARPAAKLMEEARVVLGAFPHVLQ